MYVVAWRFCRGGQRVHKYPDMSTVTVADLWLETMKKCRHLNWRRFFSELSWKTYYTSPSHIHPQNRSGALVKFTYHSVPLPPPEDIETYAALLLLKEKLWSRKKKVKNEDSSEAEGNGGGGGG